MLATIGETNEPISQLFLPVLVPPGLEVGGVKAKVQEITELFWVCLVLLVSMWSCDSCCFTDFIASGIGMHIE